MPSLRCTATTCLYNKEELCSKGDIKVSGEEAVTANETCCASFQERGSHGASNSCGCGCQTIDVDCDAYECKYNEDEKCEAERINIGGQNACVCAETLCGTFTGK